MIGTFYFVGAILGNLLLASLGDIYGRSPVLKVSMVNASLCYVVLVFLTPNFELLYLTYFIFGITSTFRIGASFLYCMEIIHSTKANIVGSFVNFFDAVHVIVMSLLLLLVTKNCYTV